ncbi:MAG TPA: hypothetical protein VKX17_23215 [Planctomycetota bacterium]|nr:hypothetical protein [Planctomycetota bacterium]
MRTLYEDWQLRRERLNFAEVLPHFEEQARVFDFLLKRYADDPAAQRPARCPLSGGLFLNSRRIILNHHSRNREFNSTRSPAEAHSRAGAILKHMRDVSTRTEPLDEAETSGNVLAKSDRRATQKLPPAPPRETVNCMSGINVSYPLPTPERLSKLFNDCRDALELDCMLSEKTVEFLIFVSRLSNLASDKFEPLFPQALEILSRCDGERVLRYFTNAWVSATAPAELQRRAALYLERAGEQCAKQALQIREARAESARDNLDDECLGVRLYAVDMLAHIGTLDDIGLFQDLLALPEVQTDPQERNAYLKAMRTLSGIEMHDMQRRG